MNRSPGSLATDHIRTCVAVEKASALEMEFSCCTRIDTQWSIVAVERGVRRQMNTRFS